MSEEITKNKGGRPRKWKTVEELQVLIDKYFEETPKEEITITGLALALDTFRDVLMDYENQYGEEFSNTIKKAKLKVQNEYEKRLVKTGNSGMIFALKNFGWKDKQEIDSNVNAKIEGISAISIK